MPKPPLDPPVADQAPVADGLTDYDQGADWAEVARIVLHIDPSGEPDRARRAWDSHLARAKWMTTHGYRHLLEGGTRH
jgi:hypothetical protein